MLNVKPGDCYLIETNHDEGGRIQSHLFVIVITLKDNPPRIIIINLQTIRGNKYDKTTVLLPGEHEFIKVPSFINYRMARIVSLDDLDRYILSGIAKTKPPMNPLVLQRICEGITHSHFTPTIIREQYLGQLYEDI